jgi:ribonuclease P protein component
MLPRRSRLPGSRLAAFKGKTIARSAFFIAKAEENGLPNSRFAVIIGKNVDPRSVRRHAIKRRINSMLVAQDFGAYDIVIIVLPALKSILLKDIPAEFQDFLRNIKK